MLLPPIGDPQRQLSRAADETKSLGLCMIGLGVIAGTCFMGNLVLLIGGSVYLASLVLSFHLPECEAARRVGIRQVRVELERLTACLVGLGEVGLDGGIEHVQQRTAVGDAGVGERVVRVDFDSLGEHLASEL